jgi:hypothetical protein
MGYISADDLRRLAQQMSGSYGRYLSEILEQDAV